MFEVEVDDFGEGVDFCDFELPDEVCETFPEFGVWIVKVSGLGDVILRLW